MAAILAAAAGGGLKAFGVDVPHLNNVARQLIVAAVGVALIGLGIYATRSAQPVSPGASAGGIGAGAEVNSGTGIEGDNGVGVEANTGAGAEVNIAQPTPAASDASSSRNELRERIARLTDAQAVTMAAMMESRLRDRSTSLGGRLQEMDPAEKRLKSAGSARDFLNYWLLQEGAPEELQQWKAALEVAEKM